MSEQQRYEKEEKEEKREEKDEKERGEKWRRDPLSAVAWAGILIWAGLALLADNLGYLARFERLSTWGVIFIGAGVIVLLEVGVRLLVPAYRRPIMGSIIFGLILIAIGLGNLISWNILWPTILIVLGGAILVRTLLGRR